MPRTKKSAFTVVLTREIDKLSNDELILLLEYVDKKIQQNKKIEILVLEEKLNRLKNDDYKPIVIYTGEKRGKK